MSKVFDITDYYEVGESISSRRYCQVHRAVEISTGSPCWFHRFDFKRKLSDREKQTATAVLKRYARLEHPRLPRLGDGLVANQEVIAVEYKPEARALNLKDNNPFTGKTDREKAALAEDMLSSLAALHEHGIVQGAIVPETWGVGPIGRAYLSDTGLDSTLVSSISQEELDVDRLSFSTNLLARDLGAWAFTVLSLMTAGPLVRSVEADERWDEFFLKEGEERIRDIFRDVRTQEFFISCLHGLGINTGTYESANDAYRYWVENRIGARMS